MSKHSHNHGSADTGESQEKENPREGSREIPPESSASEAPASQAPEADSAVSEAETATLEQKIAELEAKLADLNDQYLRKAADFENFRKRMNREKQEITEFANLNLLLDLLPVIDDFERAIKSAETSKDFASLYEGISMIEKRLSGQLESKWGLKRFDSEGEPFDPNRHEALQMEKAG
jgi:molecular chaperone GrpE